MSKMKCFWPGIALHLDEDRDVIPTYAIEKIKPGQTSDSHRMVVYFAEESYEWMSKDGILPFCEYFDELEKQPLLASRAKYRKAVEMALEWQVNQDRALENVYDMRLRQLHAQEAEKLRRKIGNLGEIPHVTCGVCIVCQSKKHESQIISFSERHIPRASTRQMKCSPLKGVRSGQNCPQLRVSICRILEHSREFTKSALLAGTLSGKERVNQRPTRPAARESGGPAYRNILAR